MPTEYHKNSDKEGSPNLKFRDEQVSSGSGRKSLQRKNIAGVRKYNLPGGSQGRERAGVGRGGKLKEPTGVTKEFDKIDSERVDCLRPVHRAS